MFSLLRRLFHFRNKSNVFSFGRTDTGRIRKNNEDTFSILEDKQVYIVADGMGGHNAGEVASRLATEIIVKSFTQKILKKIRGNKEEIRHFLIRSFHTANNKVMAHAQKNCSARGMGTTLVVGFLDGETLHICHAGDSRCYVAGNGDMRQVTRDHTSLVFSGTPSSEEKGTEPKGRQMVTKAIGFPFPEDPDYKAIPLRGNERILFCSDGLWNMVDETEIHQILISSSDPESAGNQLVKSANKAGGRDNITAIVVYT